MRGNHRKVTRRHAAPASRIKRAVAAGAVIVAGSTGTAMLAGTGAHAGTVPALSARQIMAACERGESIGIDGHTYVCVRVGTRAGMHRCEADLVSDIDQGFRFNWDSERDTRGVVAWVCGRDLLSLRQFRAAVWFAQRQESLYDS